MYYISRAVEEGEEGVEGVGQVEHESIQTNQCR